MTISYLRHTQGIRSYNYQKTERTAGTEIYYLHSKATRLPCPACLSRATSIAQTGKSRDIRGLCIGQKKTADARSNAADPIWEVCNLCSVASIPIHHR